MNFWKDQLFAVRFRFETFVPVNIFLNEVSFVGLCLMAGVIVMQMVVVVNV